MSNDIHALVGAYALDAVDDLERAAFDRHVAECESCRTELDELRETTARLADSTWSVPPPRMRTEVMSSIARTRQLAPVSPAPMITDAPRRSRRWLVAAAAAVVLAGGASTTVYQIQERRVSDLSAIAGAATQQQARTRQILTAPDLVVRTAPMIGGGKVTVASSAANKAGVIVVGAESAPPPGKVFQLWTIRGATPTSAGPLLAGQTSVVQIVDGLPGSDSVGVTTEPPGGSLVPTSTPVSLVSLA